MKEIDEDIILKYLGISEETFIRIYGINIYDIKDYERYIALGFKSLILTK